MPRPTALDAARSFRSALANDEAQAAGRMATIYNRIYTGLQGDLAKLSVDISAMDSPTRGAIMKLARMQAIQQQVKEQVTKFGGAVQNEVTIVQSQAMQAGIDNALTLIETSLPPLPDAVRGQLVASFARLPADAVEAAAGLTGQDSPLNERLSDLYGEYVAEQVGNHITDGIAKGDNPRTIARQLEKNVLNGLGSGLTSALTTVRTAQIKSYQLANHATYLANDNIVKGWVWHAELGTACLACTAEHGTVHPLEETLDGHHNCRCAPIPQTITYEELGLDIPETVEPVQSGEDWFNEQSAATQRELMGPAKYDAWKEGKFEFGQLSQKYNDPVYGELAREATLKELTEGGATPQAPEPAPDEPTPPSGPQGTPVSEALDTSGLPGRGQAIAVKDTIGVIDSVHGDGNLPVIPVGMNSSKTYSGKYTYFRGGQSVKIDVSRATDHPMMTTAHEVGHFLDHKAELAGKPVIPGDFATQIASKSPEMTELLQAIGQSDGYKELKDLRGKEVEFTYTNNSGEEVTGRAKMDSKFMNYILRNDEFFARAYAQYITVASENPAMLRELNNIRDNKGKYGYSEQWKDDDFAPIAAAFDKLFRSKGYKK